MPAMPGAALLSGAPISSRAAVSRRARVSGRHAVRAATSARGRVSGIVTRSVASPSMPSPPSLSGLPVPDFLRGPAEDIVRALDAQVPADAKKQLLRAQYTSAIGLRLAFFLSQGVLSSRVSGCLLYTSPSPRDQRGSRMPSSA